MKLEEGRHLLRRILYSEKSSSDAWVTLLVIFVGWHFAILVVAVGGYLLGHYWPFWRRLLAPRNAVGERHAFTKPFHSLARTLGEVIWTTEDELVRKSGVDAASYIRFFTLCIQLFVTLNATVLPVLLVFYAQGANPRGVTGLDELSLSNVLDQSTVIWVSLGALYFVTLVTCFLCWRHTGQVVRMRQAFLRDRKRSLEPQNYATIITCIPGPEGVLLHEPVTSKPGTGGAKGALDYAFALLLELWQTLKDVGSFFLLFLPCFHSVATGPPGTIGWAQSAAPRKSEFELLLPEAGAPGDADAPAGTGSGLSANGMPGKESAGTGSDLAAHGMPGNESAGTGSGLSANGTPSNESADQGDTEKPLDSPRLVIEAEGSAAGRPGQEYAQPGEPLCPPHISTFFRKVFRDQLLHLQPVYREALVSKAFTRWRHALRMLNESRMDWEAAREAAAKASLDKARAEGKAGEGEGEKGEGAAEEEGSQSSSGPPADVTPRHKIKKKMLFFGGETVESIPYWTAEVKAAAKELEAAQDRALQKPIPSAIIAIFKTRRAAALCHEALTSRHGNWRWKALQASPVQEMWWDNLRYTAFKDSVRTFWATVMTICMVVFFYIPVTLIASLASGKAVGTAIGGETEAVDTSWIPPVLQSVIPSLALHSVLWIFSPVFMLIARWEGRASLSDAMVVSSSRFYYCVVINVLIAYTLTSSLLTEIVNLVNGQVTVEELFGTGIPSKAPFFIVYTLNSSLMCGMELGRLPIHAVAYLVKRWMIGTAKCDHERHWDQGPMAYHVFVGYSNLIMTFGVVYAVLAPLILPFSLLYCFVAYWTWKHQVMHVYKDPVDWGGAYWIRLMHHLRNALLIAQISAVGVFGLKHAYTQMGATFGATFITLGFFTWITVQFGPVFDNDNLEELVEEEEEGEEGAEGAEGGRLAAQDPAGLASYYFPVWMRPPVLPNLDPLAPSDPDIWHHMHPTRCLFVTQDYFPTPQKALEQGKEGDSEGGGSAVPSVPEDPNERAFWEIMRVIPVNAGAKKGGRKWWGHRRRKGAALEELVEAAEPSAAAAGDQEGQKES